MMKKLILVILFIIILLFNTKAEELVIPNEAIRFRVIANSNSKEDQDSKMLVRDAIEKEISNDLNNSNNVTEARKTIQANIDNYKKIINDTLVNNNLNINYDLNYGMNYFPNKIYRGVKYEEGYYESLVVTLGDGIGKNWWCVLFPPLCLLEAEETEEKTDVEYKFFIKELLDKYF